MNKVECIIISSTLDYSSDYVCYELEQRGVSFLRINRDRFSDYSVSFDVERRSLTIVLDNTEYYIDESILKSALFRAPVFIRSNKPYSAEEQLYRSQWSSFIRNLTLFSSIKWMNHPMWTYQAENKMYQLDIAKKNGLDVPKTVVSNDSSGLIDNQLYVVKALDTPLFYENGQEMFTYSTVVNGVDIKKASLRNAPVIIQNCIIDKVDLRVTVVGDELFPASIMRMGKGIAGDWRRTKKDELQYEAVTLPKEIESRIQSLMHELNLSFGGIDLAYADGVYYFIEVNPTGEWGWLVETPGFKIQNAIVDWMVV